MKFAGLAVMFVILVTVESKRCWSGKDCEEGECCIARGMLSLIKGDCTPLAGDGESCNDENESVRGKYQLHCPCESGLSCVPEKVKDLGIFGRIKINERCVSEPTSKEPETESPVDETDEPVEETEEPVEETEAPVEETEAPAEE